MDSELLLAARAGVPLADLAALRRRKQATQDAAMRDAAARRGWTVRTVRVPGLFERLQADYVRMEREAEAYVREGERLLAARAPTPRPGSLRADVQAVLASMPVPAAFRPASFTVRVHEAAHAVVGIALGLRVLSVHADADLAEVRFEHMGPRETNAVVSIAGIEAQRMLAADSRTWQDFSESGDMRHFKAATRDLREEMQATDRAVQILHDRRAVVLRIASALENRSDLDEFDVLSLHHG